MWCAVSLVVRWQTSVLEQAACLRSDRARKIFRVPAQVAALDFRGFLDLMFYCIGQQAAHLAHDGH